MSAYSVSFALRASIALGSQPGALMFEVYPPDVGGYRFSEVNERFRWTSLSRRRSSEGCSSNVSGVALMAREGDAGGMGDSTTGVTSFCASCGGKASKVTRRSGANAVPKMSPGSRSRYPERRGLAVDPNRRSVPKSTGRFEWKSYRPCSGR